MTNQAFQIREAARRELREATGAVRAAAPAAFDRALADAEETSRRVRRSRNPFAILRRLLAWFLMLFGYQPHRNA